MGEKDNCTNPSDKKVSGGNTYTAGSGNCPELMDDVPRQEVDVIVGQRHTRILHSLPSKNQNHEEKLATEYLKNINL